MRTLIKLKLVSSIVIATVILLGCSDSKTTEEYLQLAQKSMKEGEPKQTIIYLKNLLKANPSHVEGRIQLGLAYLSEGSWLNSIKELSKAVELGGTNVPAYIGLAKAYYYNFDVTGLEELSRLSLASEDQEVIDFYYATVQIREGFIEEGLSLLRVIVAQNNQSKFSRLSGIWITAFKQEFSVAQNQLQILLKKEPEFFDAIEFSGYLALKLNETSLAVTQLQKFLNRYPDAHRVRLVYANALSLNGDYGKAEVQADFLLKVYRDNPLLNRIKAQTAFVKDDYREAKNYAEKSLVNNSQLPIARIIAGVSAYKLGSLEVAYIHLNMVAPYLSFQHPAKRILSTLKLELGYYDELYSELEAADSNDLDDEFLAFTSTELFKVGEKIKAESILNLNKDVDGEDKHLFQKGMYKLFDNDDSAIEYFKKILDKDVNNESVSTLLALELIRQEKSTEAMEVIKQVKTYNESLAYTLIGSVYKAQGDYEKAKLSYKFAMELDNNNSTAILYMGQFSELEKDYPTALSLYQNTIKLNSSHMKAHEGLFRIAKHKSVRDLVIDFLQTHLKEYSNDITTLTLSELFVKDNRVVDALALMAAKLKKEPENQRLLNYQVKLLLLNKNYDKALLTAEKLLSLKPKSSQFFTTRADIVELSGNVEKSVSILKMGLNTYPQSMEILSKLSNYYLDRGQLESAEQYVNTLSASYPNDIATYRFRGKMAFIKKDYRQAIELLSQVNSQQSALPIVLELVQSYQEVGKNAKAIELIENVEKTTQQTLPLKLLLKQAELYTDIESSKSLKIYHYLLTKTGEHFAILNNIAWIHFLANDFELAEKFARMALSKAKDSPAIMNTLGRILSAKSKLDESEVLLKQAYSNSDSNANYGISYAQVLYKLEKKGEFEQVMTELDENSMSAESKALFEKLSSK